MILELVPFPVLFTSKVVLNGLKFMVFLDVINQPREMVHVGALSTAHISTNTQVLIGCLKFNL